MLLPFSKSNLFLLPIGFALAYGYNIDSELNYPAVRLQTQQTDREINDSKRGDTVYHSKEKDEKFVLRAKNVNAAAYRPESYRYFHDLAFRLFPIEIENSKSIENDIADVGMIGDNNKRLFEPPESDEVKHPRFKTKGELSYGERLSGSNAADQNIVPLKENRKKYVDDTFDHLLDDHYDSRGEIKPKKNSNKTKYFRREKFIESEEDQDVDQFNKPNLRSFNDEDDNFSDVPAIRMEEIPSMINDSESVGSTNEEMAKDKNPASSTEPSSISHQDGNADGNRRSSIQKKATKHRKGGKKRSGRKRKGNKKSSRRNINNLAPDFKKELFMETMKSGHPVIYSDDSRSKPEENIIEKYKGIDRKPTKLEPQLRNMKMKPEMEQLHYNTVIRSRYAITTVTARVKNYGKERVINVNVILPNRALITRFETIVNDEKIAAVVKGKNSTSNLPNASVSGENIGTILVETRDCDAAAVSIKVPRDGTLNYTVTYEYLLERNLGFYAVPITIHNNMWIKDLMVRWRIEEERNLTTLQTPLIHKTTALPLEDSDDPMICIINEEPGIAEIVWEPTILEQKNISRYLGQLSNLGVVGILELRYDVQHDQDPCGQVVQQGGYFAQFFAAPNQPPLTKHVVFILDASDSMQGDPIKQLKTAMFYILDTLQPKDNFTLINFSDEVNIMNIYDRTRDTVYRGVGEGPDGRGRNSGKTPWPGNLETYEATPSNIRAAKEAVKMMKLRVFTNIYDALIMGFKSVKDILALPPAQTGQSHPEPIIIFLTDGHASDGPSYDHDVILKMVEDQNHNTKATMFALGFGGDADMGLLRRFALATNGIEKHIYKDIDAADQLVTFFQSIKAPILKDVYFKYNSKQVITATLTEQSFPMIRRGKEVITAGRLDSSYPEKSSLYVDVTALGRYAMIRCERTAEKSRKSSDENVLIKYLNATAMKQMTGNQSNRTFPDDIVERIWAFLTLNQLRDEIELDHFETHQDTRCDDMLKPIDRMLEICLRLNYAMPVITNLVYNNTVIERISISPESRDQIQEPTQFDPLTAFPWILKLRDKHGFAKLPIMNKTKGRMYTYLSLGVNENPPPPRSCADGVDGTPGECRYLPECPDPNVLGTPQKFRSHFCRLGSYAGVCCSDSVLKTSRSKGPA